MGDYNNKKMKNYLPDGRFQYGCILSRIVFRVEILFYSFFPPK